MKENLILGNEYLEKAKDLALFYPCSGDDVVVPFEIFSPYVTDFWFSDRRYFLMDRPANNQHILFSGDNRYKILSVDIVGPSSWPSSDNNIAPCILTETYRHLETDRTIRVHRRRGYGFSAFRNEPAIGKIGVFFYRGDSQGESGSGNHWLNRQHLDEVHSKLIHGGLLVIDGSDGTPNKRKGGIYKEICKYTDKNPSLSPGELIATMNEITDWKNRKYRCVGYAGMKYGPTMIWQVNTGEQ